MPRQITLHAGLSLFTLGASLSAHAQLAHRYTFDNPAGDATGATVTDEVGAADGIIRGAGALFTGAGLDLPGGSSASQAYLDLPNGIISSQTAVTIEGWVIIDATDQNWARIFDFGSSNLSEVTGPGGGGNGTDNLFLSATVGGDYNSQLLEFRNEDPAGGGNSPFPSATVTTPGVPIHFAVTWEDTGAGTSRINYWRDGIQMTTDGIINANLADLNDVNNWLGRSNWTGDANLNGTYDEFRIYDIALNEQLVLASRNAGPDTVIDFTNDSDGDLMPNAFEDLYSFLDSGDPSDASLDEDNDGLTNLEEFQQNTFPNDDDSDKDGLTDGDEVEIHTTLPRNPDSDGDGLSDGDEINLTSTLPLNPDSDGDQINDLIESQLDFLSPSNPGDAALDEDSDSLTNLQEAQLGTTLDNEDSDGDGLDDGVEVNTTNTSPIDADSDDDGLSDGDEVNITSTLPLNPDTDGDGLNDGPEVTAGSNPRQTTATTPTPIHRYSFNEAAGAADQGTIVPDSIGGAHGVIVGARATWTGDGLALPGGDGATADAAYVDLPNGLLSSQDHVTFEAWYTVNGMQSWSRVWDFGSTSSGELTTTATGDSEGLDYFFHSPNQQTDLNAQRTAVRNNDVAAPGGGIGPVDGVEEPINTALASTLGQQHHVAAIWASNGNGGGQLTLYRDGVRQGTVITTFTPRDINDVNNWLGRSNWTADNYLAGELNEFRIYQGAMNDAAVQESFTAGPDVEMEPAGELEITSLIYNPQSDRVTLTFNSVPGRVYKINWSTDLNDFSNELIDGISATGTSTTVGPLISPVSSAPKQFFRVSQ